MTTGTATAQSDKKADKKKQMAGKVLSTKVQTQLFVDKAKLRGLFVIFRCAGLPDKSTASKLYQAMFTPEPAPDPAAKKPPVPLVEIPPTTWVLGQCDEDGYLGAPAAGGPNPADTYKLIRKGKYEMVLVNHPSVDLAREITRALNEDHFFPPDVPRREYEVGEDGKIQVPLEPDRFTPTGPKQYGGFCLFEGMPLRDVKLVRDNVMKLQDDLGKLRYVVCGISAIPYVHCTTQPEQKKGEQAGEPLEGDFSKQTMNAVYAFQDAVQTKRLVKLLKAPTTSWDYIQIGGYGATASPRPDKADGVVDPKTADAIADAIANHLRRSGDILVEVEAVGHAGPKFGRKSEGFCWLRSDAAESFYAWNEIVIATGSPFGISFGHSFRSAFDVMTTSGPAPGKATKSHHKTGLALDLAMAGNFVPGTEFFPVVMTRERENHWRLYLPSVHAVPTPEEAPALAAAISARIEATLAKVPGNLKLGWFSTPAKKILAQLEAPYPFFDKYMKAEVAPWVYEPTLEGGFAEPPRPPAAPYRSWLDITQLAIDSDLQPLYALKGWRGEEKKGVVPVADVLKGKERSFLWQARQNEVDTAKSLVKLREAGKAGVMDDPTSRAVTIYRAETQTGVGAGEVPLAAVELDAFTDWVTALVPLVKAPVAGLTIASPWLTISLAARPEPPALTKLKALLADPKLADKLFWGSHDDAHEVLTGSAWSDKITQIHQGLLPPADQTDGSVGTEEPKVASYTVLLTPVFAQGEEPTTLGPNDTATVWVDYRRCQEWWHFQRESASETMWFSNLEAIGWRSECLRQAPIPALYGRTGVGYGPSRAEADAIETSRKFEAQRAAEMKKAEQEGAAKKKKEELEAAAKKKKEEADAAKKALEATKNAKKG